MSSVQDFLENGGDPNSTVPFINDDDYTLLQVAVHWSYKNETSQLLERGADANLCSKTRCPLDIAVGRDTELVRLLLEAGADPNHNLIPETGSPPLLSVASIASIEELYFKNGSFRGPFPDRLETARLLIKAGADTDYVNGFNESPLRAAVRVGDFEMAKLLLENGADVHQWVEVKAGIQRGNSVLMQALFEYEYEKNIEIVKLLLDHDANPNDANSYPYDKYCDENTIGKCTWQGYTVLTYSANKGWAEIVELLLASGADPAIPRTDGMIALDIAKNKGFTAVTSLLELP